MADKQDDILSQFAEFLDAKKQADQEKADSEDYDVEIWDEKGRGARVRRSHARPFLQSLGIDLDDDSSNSGDDAGDDKSGKSKPAAKQSTGKQSSNTQTGGIARKYFVKPATNK